MSTTDAKAPSRRVAHAFFDAREMAAGKYDHMTVRQAVESGQEEH